MTHSLGEFDLIEKYFTRHQDHPYVDLAVGDDCALIHCPADQQLAITTDSLLSGVHFLESTNPFDIAYKAVAVNVSDLAAMGAKPQFATLALALPQANEPWLQAFSAGLFQALENYHMVLIGGDTVKGPLAITLTAHGFVAKGQALCRHGAKLGDQIFVSGYLGDAGLALQQQLQTGHIADDYLYQRLQKPQARVALGQALIGIATAAIDISDGLSADLSHILRRSDCGAVIHSNQLPISDVMQRWQPDKLIQQQMALTSGDDYELCFTVPKDKVALIASLSQQHQLPLTPVGEITASKQLQILDEQGKLLRLHQPAYDHFKRNFDEKN